MRGEETRVRVRLSETDLFGMVWHGRYVSYFEVGRTALLGRFGLSASRLHERGLHPAIVRFDCELLAPARDEEVLVIHCRPEACEAAKLVLRYEITRESGGEVIARGSTTQVLLDSRGVLLYRFPPDIQEQVDKLLSSYADK
jgi:acyl-CoA thioester hydrolase